MESENELAERFPVRCLVRLETGGLNWRVIKHLPSGQVVIARRDCPDIVRTVDPAILTFVGFGEQ